MGEVIIHTMWLRETQLQSHLQQQSHLQRRLVSGRNKAAKHRKRLQRPLHACDMLLVACPAFVLGKRMTPPKSGFLRTSMQTVPTRMKATCSRTDPPRASIVLLGVPPAFALVTKVPRPLTF